MACTQSRFARQESNDTNFDNLQEHLALLSFLQEQKYPALLFISVSFKMQRTVVSWSDTGAGPSLVNSLLRLQVCQAQVKPFNTPSIKTDPRGALPIQVIVSPQICIGDLPTNELLGIFCELWGGPTTPENIY